MRRVPQLTGAASSSGPPFFWPFCNNLRFRYVLSHVPGFTREGRRPDITKRKPMRRTTSLLAVSVVALACASAPAAFAQDPSVPVSATAGDDAWTAIADAETIGDLFEAYDESQLAMNPGTKAYRGIRDEDYGKWGEVSDEAERREALMLLYAAAQMRAKFEPASLDEQDALSYRLFDLTAQRAAMLWPYRELGYVFDQRSGPHTRIPAFLINIHRVGSVDDANAYVARIAGIGEQLDAHVAEARERAEAGPIPT